MNSGARFSVDDRYLFTLRDEVTNYGAAALSLHPYALISRRGTPPTPGAHDGLIGMMGDQGLQNVTYKTIEDERFQQFDVTASMGFADEYRAAILLPDTSAHVQAEFRSVQLGPTTTYQASYLRDRQTVAPGATGSADARLFAGTKESRGCCGRGRLQQATRPQQIRSLDQLGFAVLHH